jgi:hypothetical protein
MIGYRLLLLVSCVLFVLGQIPRSHRGRIPENYQSENGYTKSSLDLRNELKDLQVLRKQLETDGIDTAEVSEMIRKTVRFLEC